MLSNRVVVTGLGAVSCFGLGVNEFWQGLVSGVSGQARIKSFDASNYRSGFAAEVPHNLFEQPDLLSLAGNPQESATFLATLAAHEAFSDAGLIDVQKKGAGCVIGTLCSGSKVFETYGRLFNKLPIKSDEQFPDPDCCLVPYQLEHIGRHFGLDGPSTLISTACSSSTDAIGYAADYIKTGEANLMLAGGADVLSEVVHAGFNTVFSITNDKSRPFDKTRSGFFIGEGAGMLVLERLDHALARGAKIYAEVFGYGLSNTAYHLTATSEDGTGEALAIERCLTDAGISSDQIDYINAHGTATEHNDLTETKALKLIFKDSLHRLAVSSIKANIGHCMGASGALEAIATVKCIVEDFIPPTLNSSGDLDSDVRVVVNTGMKHPIRYAMSQSFGFGGACSSLLMGKVTGDSLPPDLSAGRAADFSIRPAQ